MAGSKLEIGIGADISDFSKKIKEVEFDLKELSKLKVERLKLGLDTSEINNQIKEVKNTLRDLKTTSKDTGAALSSTGAAMGNFGKQTANGGSALTAFSRIAQDAPYGIIGVGNNITNTAEQFGYLVKQTGSASGAFKAMLSSLAGVGGVLLGVSLLTTGLTIMAQQGLSVGDVFDKLTGNFDESKKAMSELNKEVVKSAGTEIASMKGLLSAAQDDNLSRKERLLAVNELQSQYPAYFGNLKKEQILNGNVTTTVNELSKALRARAMATAVAGKLGELAAKRLDLEAKREQDILDIQKQQDYLRKQFAKGTAASQGISFDEYLRINLKSLRDQYKETQKEIKELDKLSEKYSTRENLATKESINLYEQKAKAIKAPETFNTPQVSGVNSLLTPAGLVPLVIPAVDSEPFAKSISNLAPLISEASQNMQLALLELNAAANELIVNTIGSTFGQLGTSIGTALATGGNVLQAIGQTLLQSLGAFLSDLGGMLIKYGTLAVIKGKLDLAILTGGPVSIAAGFAAIAVGVALKAAAGAIGAASSGGGRQASTSGGSNSNFSSSSGGFSSATSNGGTVVFEIAGQKLVGVLSNTLNANKRLGGQLGIS
jgi:hypothetical protein